MLYPYEYYLRALIIKGHGTESIMDRIKTLKLTPPDAMDIETKREELFNLLPEDSIVCITPGVKYSFEKFLQKAKKQLPLLEIDEVITVLDGKRDPEWEDTLLIMTDPALRVLATCMSVYGNSDEEIMDMMFSRHRITVSQRSFDMFKKYFWNIGRLTKLELFHYVSSLESIKHKELLIDAFHKRDLNLKWKISGENILTLENILEEVMNEAFTKFKASVGSDDTDNVQKVMKWAELAIKSAEKYKNITRKDSENIVKTLEFKLKKMSQADITNKDNVDGDVA